MSTNEKKSFYVQREGWVLDLYRQVNDEVKATDEEVKYLVRAGNLGPAKVSAADKRKAASSAPAIETSPSSETPASKAVAEKTKG